MATTVGRAEPLLKPLDIGERLLDLHDVLNAIGGAITLYPELRVCQLIVNATRNDPFYITDRDLVVGIKRLMRELERR